jgi:hypothetical protein
LGSMHEFDEFTGEKKPKTKNFKILAVGFLSTIHRISCQPNHFSFFETGHKKKG